MNVHLSPSEERIIKYIKVNGSITALQAALDLRCVSLPQRIFDLRHKGWKIVKTDVRRKNEDGEYVSFAKYTLAS